MAGYIGTAAVPQATQKRQAFTATSNQTTFATSGYTVGFVDVYLNGVKLAAADYTATNGSDVVLASGATASDIVEIISFTSFTVSGALQVANNLSDLGSASTALTNLGVTSTAAELNLIDGGTARGTTALADGDGLLVNDAGTMRMTNVQTVKTYMTAGVGGGGTEFIASSGAISNAATVAFTAFDSSKYDHYMFYMQHVYPASSGANLLAHASTDGGSNYDTTNGNYHSINTDDQTGFLIALSLGHSDVGQDEAAGVSGVFYLFAPHSTKQTLARAIVTSMNGLSYIMRPDYGDYQTAHLVSEDTDAVQFKMSSGNITSGEITMFGVKNS